MEKYLVALCVITLLIYGLTWLLSLPMVIANRTSFRKLFPDYSNISDLTEDQKIDWESKAANNLSSPFFSTLSFISILIHYPNILVHSVIRQKDEFGGHLMIITSSLVWWGISLFFI